MPAWAHQRPSRKHWAWHRPDGEHECQKLKEQDRYAYGALIQELERLTRRGTGRPGQPATGRIRQSAVPTGPTSLAVLFVERRDKGGLGGLLLLQCDTSECAPPEGAYESAHYRLSEMTKW